MRSHRLEFMLCLFLAVVTLAVYWQIGNFDFIALDDGIYVSKNPHVQAGLTKQNVLWAFTNLDANFWHPLTWLSHMLDVQLFGLKPGMHHLTNLLFHVANSILLFLTFRRMTGAIWRSAFVAALFALHPLHVESVAWIAERKDVLSTFFWMLAMWAYAGYAKRPGLGGYLLVFVFFVLGLMSKPMVVTLPFVLLLLDFWPLGRLTLWKSGKQESSEDLKPTIFHLLLEKVPFLVLAAVASMVAFFAQQKAGAIHLSDVLSIDIRIANSTINCLNYITKMLWPINLSVFYTYPEAVALWKGIAAGSFLISFSLLTVVTVKKFPYLLVGWLWYLGTLVPVIGLVQVGAHSMADRYTYIPLIGLLVMVSWCVPDLLRKWPRRRIPLTVSAGIVLVILICRTWIQAGFWKDTITLFTHALSVDADNYVAHNSLGIGLDKEGRHKEAIKHYFKALKLRPDYAEAHNNFGVALERNGNTDAAIRHYKEALKHSPGFAMAKRNLGLIFQKQGRLEHAIEHFTEIVRVNPDSAEAHYDLGNLLFRQGALKDAIRHYKEALRIDPYDIKTHNNLGVALKEQGRLDEAIRRYTEALRINPDFADAHNNLGLALQQQGRLKDAVRHFAHAVRIDPLDPELQTNLGAALAETGRHQEAIKYFLEALGINPDLVRARRNLEIVTNRIGKSEAYIRNPKPDKQEK